MRKFFLSLLMALCMALSIGAVNTAQAGYSTWKEVAGAMDKVLVESITAYRAGDAKTAKKKVNEAYYQFYEKIGFERNTMAHISGNRASEVEYVFGTIKKMINKGVDAAEYEKEARHLSAMLMEDAKALDGESDSPWSIFLASFLIMLREGFEAILIVGAILAYLVKSGNAEKQRPVYWGAVLAIAASFVMAWILNMMAGDNGENQELTEGLTMFVAVAVLFYVSNFMIGKADAAAWQGYIKGKVNTSIASGSMFALAFTAFLAVFREGAEVILFYQALFVSTPHHDMLWYGFGAGCLALVFVYIFIRFLSIKLPLKPFFVGTSLLMYVMCVAFVGQGVKELQEGNFIGVTTVSGVPTIDLLGVYPTVESLVPQAIMFALCVLTVVLGVRGWKKNRIQMEREACEAHPAQ